MYSRMLFFGEENEKITVGYRIFGSPAKIVEA
jgi:hypothetical protein